jgi:hypothetical protein
MKPEGGRMRVDAGQAGWSTATDVIVALREELLQWAFIREKVLEKLDVKGARRARQIVDDLDRLALEITRLASVGVVISADDQLIALHTLLDEIDTLTSSDAERSSFSRVSERVPILHDDEDLEPTVPGRRLVGA